MVRRLALLTLATTGDLDSATAVRAAHDYDIVQPDPGALVLLLLAVVSGCGTGSNGFKNIGTPVGTYHLTITASSGAIQQTTNVILVVK